MCRETTEQTKTMYASQQSVLFDLGKNNATNIYGRGLIGRHQLTLGRSYHDLNIYIVGIITPKLFVWTVCIHDMVHSPVRRLKTLMDLVSAAGVCIKTYSCLN